MPISYKNYANLFCMSCIVLKKFCLPLVYPWYRIVPCRLRVHDGFICYLHYVITIRLLYDNYVIHIPCLSLRYPFGIPSEWYRGGKGRKYVRKCDFCEHIFRHSRTFSKSPQKFIPTSLLPENQGLIQKSLHVGFVVIVVFKPSKPTITTFPTLVVFIPYVIWLCR